MKLQNEPDHIHVPKTVSVPALCTVDGMEYTVCVDCGETIGDTVVIPAIGHNPKKYYVCTSYRQYGLKGKLCTSHYLRYDVLYSYVLLRLRYLAEYAQRYSAAFVAFIKKIFVSSNMFLNR